MGVGSILNRMCLELKNIPMKILCVMLVILQSFFMDVVIITCYGDGDSSGDVCEPCQNCWWWIAGDIIICILFVVTLSISYKHLAYHSKCKQLHKHYLKGGLPLSCVTWFVYSSAVAAKVIVIFKSGIDDKLDEESFYGPQFLKTGICLCGVVFILFVASHHHHDESERDRMYINSMATGVTFDVLDTVDFLDVLFVKDTGLILPFALENAILAIAIINLLRPTFSFVVLVLNHFGATKKGRELSAANAIVYIFLVNTPFMAIRMFLWHNLNHDVSVFLIKNFVMIFIGIHELYQISMEKTKAKSRDNMIEMPQLTTAHRPSDVRDSPNDDVPPEYSHSQSLVENNPPDNQA